MKLWQSVQLKALIVVPDRGYACSIRTTLELGGTFSMNLSSQVSPEGRQAAEQMATTGTKVAPDAQMPRSMIGGGEGTTQWEFLRPMCKNPRSAHRCSNPAIWSVSGQFGRKSCARPE